MTEKEQLIEAWTSPLQNNAEQHLHARSLLEEAIEENAPTLPTAAKWMQQTRHARKRRLLLWCLFILALASFLYPVLTTYGMNVSLMVYRSVTSMDVSKAPKVRTSSAEETFLLYGDLSRPKASDQRRALWERDPQNAAYFAEYAIHYFSETASLPPDFLKTAADIDPDNAWYYAAAAANKSKGICRKEKTNHANSPVTTAQLKLLHGEERRKMGHRIVHEYTIVNPVAMKEVLALWRQSLQHKRYENYVIPLHQMRYPILSQHVSFARYTTNIVYLFDNPSFLFRDRHLSEVLVTALQKADMQSEEGKQLFRDITAYTERIAAKEPATLVDVLLTRVILTALYKQIDVIDTTALEPAELAFWKQRNQAMQQLNDDLTMQADTKSDFIHHHGSLLTALTLPMLQKQTKPPLHVSHEDLKPMRYTEHCVFLHFLAAVCCLLMLTLVPYHLLFRKKKMTHRLSDTIWHGMPWHSLALLMLCSVVAPLIYFTVLTVWTPLTGKEYGSGMGYIFPVYPALCIALILLLLPRLLARHFTAIWQDLHPKRKPWYSRLGWVAFFLLLLPLHLLPTILQATNSYVYAIGFMGACALPTILWLLWTLFEGFFTRGFYPAVMYSLRRRVVGACTLSGIIFLSVTCWALKQCESYWLKKDTVMAVSPEKPTFCYEAEITKRAHADLQRVMYDGKK